MANPIKLLLHLIPVQITPCAGQAESVISGIGRESSVGGFLLCKVTNDVSVVLVKENTNQGLVGGNCKTRLLNRAVCHLTTSLPLYPYHIGP